ncbi:HAD family phosphatase [Streptococcus suis]|nr:HAD family phosphatase [Streptococcus suis]
MIRLLAIDLDGTLLTSEKTIHPRDKAAIQAASQLGVTILLATGRPISGIRDYFEQLDIPEQPYAIGNNGCLTLATKDWSILDYHSVPAEQLSSLYALLEDFPDLNLVLFTPHANYALGKFLNEAAIQDAQVESSVLYHIQLDDFLALQLPVLVPIFMGETERLTAFQKRYESDLSQHYHPVRSLDHAFEILPKGVNKGSAVLALAHKLKISPEQIMAIGDGNNDTELLTVAGLGIAMGNATAAIQSLADYTTTTNDQAGVAKAIEHFILSQNE